jgi:hypothetical protein
MTSQAIAYDPMVRAAGGIAILCGIVSSIGVTLLAGMYVLFWTSDLSLGLTLGMLNDITVALQYLLSIPIALALCRILLPYHPALMRIATLVGIAMLLVVVGLQLLLIFGVMSFDVQVIWVSLAMIVGVGSWLVITGLVARSTGKLPRSMLMSAIAVPYVGYPLWAFWLGRHLLRW